MFILYIFAWCLMFGAYVFAHSIDVWCLMLMSTAIFLHKTIYSQKILMLPSHKHVRFYKILKVTRLTFRSTITRMTFHFYIFQLLAKTHRHVAPGHLMTKKWSSISSQTGIGLWKYMVRGCQKWKKKLNWTPGTFQYLRLKFWPFFIVKWPKLAIFNSMKRTFYATKSICFCF